MPRIGKRCHELPINDKDAIWRIIYRLDLDAVIILEVFSKKAAQTPKQVIENCKRKLNAYVQLEKKKKLESKGWKVGTANEFLGLTQEESTLLDLKIRLGMTLQKERKANHLTQAQLARRIHSSQSRVAKMEGGDPSVTIDLLLKSLLNLGIEKKNLAEVIAG